MGQLRALVLVVLFTAALARNVDRPRLRRRAPKMTELWRKSSGVGSFKDVGTAGGNALTKPKVLQCTQEGYFPQPGSCTQFYRCVDWLGTGTYFSTFRFSCPYGTVFDDDLDVCNHPGAVKNPAECSGAMGDLPLPEPPGVDTPSTGDQAAGSGSGTGATTISGDDTEPCNGTLAPYPVPDYVTTTTTESSQPSVEPTQEPTTLIGWVTQEPTTVIGGITDESTTFMGAMTDEPTTVLNGVEETTLDPAVEGTTQKVWQVDPTSIYACPAPGYYPFEGDCVRFYKCVVTVANTLKGLLYKCPTGFGYSEERQRCWKLDDLPPCMRMPQLAHQRLETATALYEEDLLWFFNNRK